MIPSHRDNDAVDDGAIIDTSNHRTYSGQEAGGDLPWGMILLQRESA